MENINTQENKYTKFSSEEFECAKHIRDVSYSGSEFASRRGSELSDQFTQLEVQIATILTGFTGLFAGYFNSSFDPAKATGIFQSIILVLVLKLMFASSLFFLILSLILGLIHIKRKERFWDDSMYIRATRHKKWRTAIIEGTFQDAMSFHEGTTLDKPIVVSSPNWTWVLQTVCLGIAFLQIFILFLVFLFR